MTSATGDRQATHPYSRIAPPDGATSQVAGVPLPTVADQTEEQLGGSTSVLVRQRRDHARLHELLDAAARTRGQEQDDVLTSLARLVFPHAYAEETVLWPVLRAALPDGEELTLRNEHQQINQAFAELDRSPASFQTRTAPTRPCAAVSRRPPGNMLSGVPLTALDRSRDQLERFARRCPAQAGPLTAAGRVLAVLAGAIGNLPPLTRREHPSTRAGRTHAAS